MADSVIDPDGGRRTRWEGEAHMLPTVLVAYASKHGSTAEIAERIAATLRDCGLDAQARPAADVGDLAPYDAVVLASAVYMLRWLRDARRFARYHRMTLRDVPVWLFSSGPVGTEEQRRKTPDPRTAKRLIKYLHPRAHVMFGGCLSDDATAFVERKMLESTPPELRDARDWDQIEAWAQSVARELGAPMPVRADPAPLSG